MKAFACLLTLIIVGFMVTPGFASASFLSGGDVFAILKEIYQEAAEMEGEDGEGFIEREFFIELDKNDENKEEHVIFLSQRIKDEEKVLLQITYFKPSETQTRVKYPRETREIVYYLRGEEVIFKECNFESGELELLLKDILKGIQNKKKLLKLIHPEARFFKGMIYISNL